MRGSRCAGARCETGARFAVRSGCRTCEPRTRAPFDIAPAHPSAPSYTSGVTDHLNPQAREMADESMVRNLAAQADAIWPQEEPLFDRYQLPAEASVLDAGCGTGEIS